VLRSAGDLGRDTGTGKFSLKRGDHVVDVALAVDAALVDWLAISKDHPEYFVKDGFHLTDVGQEAYAGAIRAKLFELFAKESNATSTTTAKPAKKQKAAA